MTPTELVLRKLGISYEREGTRAWSACPYHDDEHPSWSINVSGERAGLHHCFACKRGGQLVDLVRRVRGCTIDEAEDWLEEVEAHHEPEVRELRVVERPAVIGARRVFRLPPEVVVEPLADWPSPARRYIEKPDRGVTAEQVARYGLGYAVEGRLAGRIVIPFRGRGGVPLSYSARTFVGDEPRYLTPHEREGASEGAVFGESAWPDERRVVVVTEGAIDALAAARAVPEAAVAALNGSSFATSQVARLGTFRRVVAMTDSDPPGDKCADQIEAAIGRHVDVRRARLPEGTDAAKIGLHALRAFLAPLVA